MSRVARLGAFIIATLAILAVGLFLIGSKQYLFSNTYQLQTQFANVVGLDVGAEVRVGGVHGGTVRSIALPHRPSDQIAVVMDMDSATREIVKKDSVASIETEGLLGNQYMAVSFGSAGGANVNSGDTIAGQPPLLMADLLKKADGILVTSQGALENVTKVTANMNSISAKINNGQGTVGALINDKKIYNEMDQSMAGIRDTMVQAQAGVTDFQENMEALKHSFFVRGYFKNRGYEDAADLEKDEIAAMPVSAPLKKFAVDAKQLFEKQDTAKLKNPKSLAPAGEFLANNDFGFAVVVAYSSMEGDSAKNLLLTQGRARVVREYLAENFSFDDSHMKTLGLGKKDGVSPAKGWGVIEIDVYPSGAEVPANLKPQNTASTKAPPDPSAAPPPKPQ